MVRIELPGVLKDAARVLKATGQGGRVDQLVTAMNRAAEAAVPETRSLFVAAARSVGIEDARRIVGGGATSVTDFFAGKTREPLGERLLPIVKQTTARVRLTGLYNDVAGRVAAWGLVKPGQARIEQQVTDRAIEGLLVMMGEEERRLRADPVKSGSALLRKVFGS